MSLAFINGVAPIVTVSGPGNIHHLSYGSVSGLTSTVGIMPTANEGTTTFVIGFSYTFTNYAFYWDGFGPAVWSLGDSIFAEPVGTSWTDATGLVWGSSEITLGVNVEANVTGALNRDDEVIVYVIPNLNDLD
ncbi:hypothetical protein MSAN_01111900 [Mycena sanguinolenta]|uniref:Uncharacterized protein n=1 Tax=Mycena sanguinolenta TaxID=230812 RepID=A0A8H6YLC6_9AGAR|nr:hypothetical protein MSAN_01111900 [Mycena sanguinolenta]